MGALISIFKKSDNTKTESEIKEEEYIKMIEELEKQEKALINAFEEAEKNKKKQKEESVVRQKEESETRINELNDTIERAEELNDERTMLNIQASQLLCAIYYNYQFGHIDDEVDENWRKNVTTVINSCLNVKSFWLLCKIPQLLPLLWFTGSECDMFHDYVIDEKGNVNKVAYKSLINKHINTYITSILPSYLTNVCRSNCKKYTDINEDRNTEISNKCKKYLSNIENVTSDEEWYNQTIKFIEDDDIMNWKCFSARSGKGITTKQIKLLPATYPKICHKYELYEALLMVTNTVINHYGDIRTEKGIRVTTNSTKNTNNGGQCFALNSTWIENVYNKAFSTKGIWDCESYINVDDIVLSEKDITGYDDDAWMKETKTYDVTHMYGRNADGTGGFLKYINPTQKYTQQFINDIDNIEVAFQMPRLSATINDEFKNNFLYNIFKTLTTNKDYLLFNVYNIDNKIILTSMDYLYIVPSGFEQIDNVSPICRYIFEVLIKDSCKWYITFPIENTMSMMKINSNILLYDDDKSILPQYIWGKSMDYRPLFRFIQKTLLLYAIAILIFLPVNLYAGQLENIEAIDLIRMLIFDGTFYHLWYLPALLLGFALVWAGLKALPWKAVLGISVFLYLLGLPGDSYYGFLKDGSVLRQLYDGFFHLSSYTRNGLFYAPVFLALGYAVSRQYGDGTASGKAVRRLPFSVTLAALGVCTALLLAEGITLKILEVQRHDSMYLALVPLMYFLFLSLLDARGPDPMKRLPKELPLLVYVLHPLFLILVRGFSGLTNLSMLTENSLVHFLAVALSSFAGSWLLAVLWELARKHILSRLGPWLPGLFKSITDRRGYHDHKHKL